MNSDWLDLLAELDAAQVRYLVVGAHAVGVHGIPRATRDIDIWIDPAAENVKQVWAALIRFGAPLDDLGIKHRDLANPDQVVQFGVPPNRIDLMTSLSGIGDFEAAWARRHLGEVDGRKVFVLGRADLIANKRASGRDKDRIDLKELGEL